MTLVRINHDPSTPQLAVFGLLWLAFFAAAAAALLRADAPLAALVLGVTAALPPALGWVWPSWLRRLYLAAAYATYPIGLVVSWCLLLLIYYGVAAPIGCVLRSLGSDPLNRRPRDPPPPTYWGERPPPPPPERYYRQF